MDFPKQGRKRFQTGERSPRRQNATGVRVFLLYLREEIKDPNAVVFFMEMSRRLYEDYLSI